MIGIYKITSPTNKVYIGSSNNIFNRWCSYKNLKCLTQTKLYRSFLKHGVDNHVFEINGPFDNIYVYYRWQIHEQY